MRSAVLMICLLTVGLAIAGASTRSSALPNPAFTPGALNQNVTQADIHSTICLHGWTATVRPPESYTNKLKREQIKEYGYADTRMRDYEEDHLVSLELGGSPTSPLNLWPQPYAGRWGARVKDRLEDRLHRLVCQGKITLAVARAAIRKNWVRAYAHYLPARSPR